MFNASSLLQVKFLYLFNKVICQIKLWLFYILQLSSLRVNQYMILTHFEIFSCCYDSARLSLVSTSIRSIEAVDATSLVYRSDDEDLFPIFKSCCNIENLINGLSPISMCFDFLRRRPPCSSFSFRRSCK